MSNISEFCENFNHENLNSLFGINLADIKLEPLENTFSPPSSSDSTLSNKEKKTKRRYKNNKQRRLSNRESARKCRERKKQQMEFLQDTVDSLYHENHILRRELCELFAIQQMALETLDNETRNRLKREFCVAKFYKKVQQIDAQSRLHHK